MHITCVWLKMLQLRLKNKLFYDRRVLRASQQNIQHPHIMSLFGVPTPSIFSTPPPSCTPSPETLTGIKSNSCALRQGDGQFGPLATRRPATGYEPNFCIDVSSEHTPINFPSRKDSFTLENDLTNTVAASEDFDGHLPQRFVASSSQHSAASTIPTLLNLARFSPQVAPGNW